MTSEAVFQSIVQEHLGDPAISQARMFGSPCLSVGGKIFAALYKGRLVLKLARSRVEELTAGPQAELFDPGHGRVSKEWVSIGADMESQWRELAREAKQFVGRAGREAAGGRRARQSR